MTRYHPIMPAREPDPDEEHERAMRVLDLRELVVTGTVIASGLFAASIAVAIVTGTLWALIPWFIGTAAWAVRESDRYELERLDR